MMLFISGGEEQDVHLPNQLVPILEVFSLVKLNILFENTSIAHVD